MTETTDGWSYFNKSDEEWEWAQTRPAINDDVKIVKACNLIDFQMEHISKERLICERDACAELAAALKKCMEPRRWTKEMSDAWHNSLPDTEKAFKALRMAV